MLNPLISNVPVCEEIKKLLLYYLLLFLSTQEELRVTNENISSTQNVSICF